jgi:hypothetical protein
MVGIEAGAENLVRMLKTFFFVIHCLDKNKLECFFLANIFCLGLYLQARLRA